MSKKDDFSFDSLDSFDSIDTGFDNVQSDSNGLDDAFDTGFDNDFDNFDSNETGDKKSLIKTSIIMICIGLLIIVGGIGLSKAINLAANKAGKEPTIKTEQPKNVESNPGQIDRQPKENSNTDGWINFNTTDSEINIDDKIDTTFTVVNIEHFVKITDGTGNNIAVKTVVTGNISGFIGTYDLELPYEKGIRVTRGMTFNVSVSYGEYNGKTVVSSIEY